MVELTTRLVGASLTPTPSRKTIITRDKCSLKDSDQIELVGKSNRFLASSLEFATIQKKPRLLSIGYPRATNRSGL